MENDLVDRLIRTVAQAFYSDEVRILVFFKQLLPWTILAEDIIADRMSLSIKEVAKIAHILREERLIKSYNRQEIREWDQKSVGRLYHYIDKASFVDVTRYRLNRMHSWLEERVKNEVDDRGYICRRCDRTFSMLDVGKIFQPQTGIFQCDFCKEELEESLNINLKKSFLAPLPTTVVSTSKKSKKTKEEEPLLPSKEDQIDIKGQSKLTEETNHIVRLLRLIEDSKVLDGIGPFDIEKEIHHLPIASFASSNESISIISQGGSISPLSIQSNTSGNVREDFCLNGDIDDGIEVFIVGEDEEDEEDGGSSSILQREKTFDNILPQWYTKSTIKGISKEAEGENNINVKNGITSIDDGGDDEMFGSIVESPIVTINRSIIEKSALIVNVVEVTSHPHQTNVVTTKIIPEKIQITVNGIPKDSSLINDEDMSQMTEEEYLAYYEEINRQ